MFVAISNDFAATPVILCVGNSAEELIDQLSMWSCDGIIAGEQQAAIFETCKLPDVLIDSDFKGLPRIIIGAPDEQISVFIQTLFV